MGKNKKQFITAGIFLLVFAVSFLFGESIVRNGTPCQTKEYEALKPPHRGSVTGFNLNTASKEALISIKGIGEAYAKSIIETRNKMGHFKSVYDLEYAYGIGEKRIEHRKQFIRID